MKANTLRLGLMLAIAAFWQVSPLHAEEFLNEPVDNVSASYQEDGYEASDYGEKEDETLVTPLGSVDEVFEETTGESAVPDVMTVGLFRNMYSAAGSAAGSCYDGYSCLRDNCELPPLRISGCVSDCCQNYGTVLSIGNNAFKGISDNGAESNFGLVSSVNVGASPGMLADRGIGVQVGGSYGIYDFSGRTASVAEQSSVQEQFFLTFGAFRRAEACQQIQGGIVYDVMANDNWGTFSNEPFLTQWRAQGEYLLSDFNSIGIIVTRRDHGDDQLIGPAIPGATGVWRPVSQASFFFHHRWDNGADSYLWLGFPEKQRPGDAPGSLGQSIIGTSFHVPVTDAMGVYTTGTYMRPSSGPGAAGAGEETWNIGMGLTWFPGRNAASPSVAGNCNMPYMPVANNGNFLVDRAILP